MREWVKKSLKGGFVLISFFCYFDKERKIINDRYTIDQLASIMDGNQYFDVHY